MDSPMQEAETLSAPTPDELQLAIEQRAEQDNFLLYLQHEIELRQELRAAPRRSLRLPAKRKTLTPAATNAATVPTPRPRTRSTRERPARASTQGKHKPDGTCVPTPKPTTPRLTIAQRTWLLRIRLLPDQGETNWKLVAILFEDTFAKKIAPEVAKATSDALYSAAGAAADTDARE